MSLNLDINFIGGQWMAQMNNVYIYANFADRKFVTLELASNVVVVVVVSTF